MIAETNEIKKLTAENFELETSQANGPILIDFWAEWCGPCKQMNPVLDQLADEVAGQATIAKVNVDQSPELAQKFGVQSIPTFIVLKNGKEVERRNGVANLGTLKDLIS